jgi:hypothetical protein
MFLIYGIDYSSFRILDADTLGLALWTLAENFLFFFLFKSSSNS